jgi:hypothetical protein
MPTIKRPFACLMLLVLTAAPLFADLSDLKEKMIESERKAEKEDEPPADARTDEQSEAETLLAWNILRLWLYVNVLVEYDEYPYATGRYIRYGDQQESWKFYRFSVGSDLFIAPDNGAGAQSTFEGKIFPLLGPRFEVMSLFDGSERLHIALLGGTISLFQSSWLSADAYVQWAAMRGILHRDGMAAGLILTSYPFDPIGVTLTFGTQEYDGGLSMEEFSLAVSRHFGRLSAYAGWKSLSAPEYSIEGPFVGLRAHY